MRDYDTIEPDMALNMVLRQAPRLAPRIVSTFEALDLVLAEDVHAEEDLPPFPCSIKDGFAVIAADTSNPRRLVGEQTAGYVADLRVEPGTCVRITTGAPMPPGADAVIMVEYTEEADGKVTLHRQVRSNAEVRPVAQDIAKGQQVLQAGTCLGPQEIRLVGQSGSYQRSGPTHDRRWLCCPVATRLSSRTPYPVQDRFATATGTRSWPRCSAPGPKPFRSASAATRGRP